MRRFDVAAARHRPGLGRVESAANDTILSAMKHQLTVWYDGACPLCLREIALMRRLNRRDTIEFVDGTRSAAENCPIDQAQLLERFHANEDGKLLSGAEAFAAMWLAIPLLRPLGLLARNRRVLQALELLYTLFLRHRPKLQQRVARRQWCVIEREV